MSFQKKIFATAAMLAGGLFTTVPSVGFAQVQTGVPTSGTALATTAPSTNIGGVGGLGTAGTLGGGFGNGGFARSGGIGTIGGIGTGGTLRGGFGNGGPGGFGRTGVGSSSALGPGNFGTRGGNEFGLTGRSGLYTGTRGGGELGIGDGGNATGILPPNGTRGGNERGIGLTNQGGVGAPAGNGFGGARGFDNLGNGTAGLGGNQFGAGTTNPTGFDQGGFRFRNPGLGTSTAAGSGLGLYGLGTSATSVPPAQGDAGSTLFNDTNGLFNTR